MSKKKTGFTALLAKFPKATLPLTLEPETVREFDKTNKPLSEENISLFLADEGVEYDEFAEWVPCCRLPEAGKFHGLIYWQAGLLEYHYMLATFDKTGNRLHKKRIGGTISDGNAFKVVVATIKTSWQIETVEGTASQNTSLIPNQLTKHHTFNISEDGTIQ